MEERIRFINHLGNKILLVDFSNCPAKEVERIARAVPDYVTVQPRNSVLVLTDFSGAVFKPDTGCNAGGVEAGVERRAQGLCCACRRAS